MRTLLALFEITRPDTSVLAFLAVMLAIYSRTGDVPKSFQMAVPLLLTSMCTFIVNDIDDMDKDRINHPERPLPSGRLQPALAVITYYFCLVAALLAIRFFITSSTTAFWYYYLLVIAVSYSYVTEHLPGLKSVYVALAAPLPIIIIFAHYPGELHLACIAGAVALFTLGREICMDIRDRPGDPTSFMHKVQPQHAALAAFMMQAGGLFLVLAQTESRLDYLVTALMAVPITLSSVAWFAFRQLRVATGLMKVALFLGLYFIL